ncbi:MAG TPA: winged helix-turn-helix domain-containing protein [Mycobacteriales bacterium]|nr:winged helix-turn-helix domain-containing protein [Mycobacteriales bacterium]
MAKPPVKAQQLAGELGERIRSGEWKPGDWLPSERQLAETYGAGRSTVRQAVEMLAATGLVEPVAGSGARVCAATGAPVVLDAAAVQAQLDAIHAELRRVNDRLGVIEGRGEAHSTDD